LYFAEGQDEYALCHSISDLPDYFWNGIVFDTASPRNPGAAVMR
jgi:hypothetical protein